MIVARSFARIHETNLKVCLQLSLVVAHVLNAYAETRHPATMVR